jgi:hypothetical protein
VDGAVASRALDPVLEPHQPAARILERPGGGVLLPREGRALARALDALVQADGGERPVGIGDAEEDGRVADHRSVRHSAHHAQDTLRPPARP